MNFNCSDELKASHALYVADLINKKDPAAAASGCELGDVRECAKSRCWNGVHYHPIIEHAFERRLQAHVGDQRGVSSTGKLLTVGVCAEQQAANKVLKNSYPEDKEENVYCYNSDISRLKFTEAIRPKSKKTIPPCENCQLLFD